MTTYAGDWIMSFARCGSIATKAMSHAPVFTASTTRPAAANGTISSGTPRRFASSRDRSTETPRGSPVAGSFEARTGLPKLIAARSLPVGASWDTTSGVGLGGSDEQAAASAARRTAIRRIGLQRLDLDLAELHHARAVLERDRAARVLAVLNVHGLHPVQHDGEVRTLRGDLVGIPPAPRLEHGHGFRDVDDRAGAEARIGALVEDVDLVAGLGADLLRVGVAEEDAAVGVGVDPELRPHLEVGVGILRHEIALALVAAVGHDDTVDDSPVRVSDLVPVVHALAVEEHDPARLRRRRRHGRAGAESGGGEPDDEKCQFPHDDLLLSWMLTRFPRILQRLSIRGITRRVCAFP